MKHHNCQPRQRPDHQTLSRTVEADRLQL